MRLLVSLWVLVMAAAPAHAGQKLSFQTIHRVLKARKATFQACYQKELQRDPTLAPGGQMAVSFTIKRNGKVASASVSTAYHPRVDECVRRNVEQLVFPASSSDLKVTYPFKFGG